MTRRSYMFILTSTNIFWIFNNLPFRVLSSPVCKGTRNGSFPLTLSFRPYLTSSRMVRIPLIFSPLVMLSTCSSFSRLTAA